MKKLGRRKGAKVGTNWTCSAGHFHKKKERCPETGEGSNYHLTRVDQRPLGMRK